MARAEITVNISELPATKAAIAAARTAERQRWIAAMEALAEEMEGLADHWRASIPYASDAYETTAARLRGLITSSAIAARRAAGEEA